MTSSRGSRAIFQTKTGVKWLVPLKDKPCNQIFDTVSKEPISKVLKAAGAVVIGVR